MPTSTDAQGFDYKAARIAATRVVWLQKGLATKSLLSFSELVHELVEDIWKAANSKVAPFDPLKSKFNTFAIAIAKKRLRDHARDAQRRLKKQNRAIEAATDKAQDGGIISQDFPSFICNDQSPRCITPRANRYRGGRAGVDARKLAAAMLLKSRRGWSWVTLHQQLTSNQDLAVSLGFHKVPGLATFKRFPRRLKRYARQRLKSIS